jgi:putative membrane protein
MMMWWDGGWLWMGLMVLLMLVFWGGVIALIIWVITRFTRREVPHDSRSGRPDALDIARERYARGEITKEQFEQIKKDLT